MALPGRSEEQGAAHPPAVQADGSIAGQLCTICQTTILAGEQVLECPDCALPFHTECWMENKGCSAYGCQSAPKTGKQAPEAPVVSNAWGEEKPCPACAKPIRAEALKCRFCGAVFNSRDVISRQEYASREYEGTEYAAVRNKVIALFFLSAAGCLAPLGLLLCGLLIHHRNLMGIDYARLPSTLRALVWSSIGLGSLLMLIMVCLVALDR